MAKQKVLRNVNSAHTCVLDQINWMRKKKKKRKKIPHSLTRFACVSVCSRECVQLWLADCLQWNVSCPHHMTRCAAVMCVRTYLCVCVIKCVCVSALHSQECVRVTGRQTDGRRAKERQQGAGKSIDNVTSFIILHWHCDTLRVVFVRRVRSPRGSASKRSRMLKASRKSLNDFFQKLT